MQYPISERVGAFIIRKNGRGLYELLLFQHPNNRHPQNHQARWQVPGGGIEPGETEDVALYREIHEESGLRDLAIVRKLGTVERCWLDTKVTTRRHYYLLEPQRPTRDRWEHVVHGTGQDAGLKFSYFWYRPNKNFVLHGGSGLILTPQNIPELYAPELCTELYPEICPVSSLAQAS